MRPQRVNLLHAELRGDGIPNAWRQENFGTPAGPAADEDTDGDGYDNAAEEIAGTHPLAAGSLFAMADPSGPPVALRWIFASNRVYDVWFTADLLQPFQPLATDLATNAFAPASNGFYRLRVRK